MSTAREADRGRADEPIGSVRLARRPAYMQGDLARPGVRQALDWLAGRSAAGPIDLGDDPDGDMDGVL